MQAIKPVHETIMRKFGLIGFPLGHSFSKGYFSKKFEIEKLNDCVYENYPIERIELLNDIINNNPELKGLNVTIPYKQQVMKHLDRIDAEASEVGAVNTIKIVKEDSGIKLIGYNTDIFGFEKPLLEKLVAFHKSALILGTGGASKAVAYILHKHGISFRYVSRNPKEDTVYSYSDLTHEIVQEYKIIVNTSPLGMHPDTDKCPSIPYEAIGKDHILYDLIYNPEETLFLRKGEERKAIVINGLPMLYIQAEKSWEIWNS